MESLKNKLISWVNSLDSSPEVILTAMYVLHYAALAIGLLLAPVTWLKSLLAKKIRISEG